jgi:hypothetical protein
MYFALLNGKKLFLGRILLCKYRQSEFNYLNEEHAIENQPQAHYFPAIKTNFVTEN